jgi:predicted RNase H-like nuclease (RuvC/YqgF family)
LSHGWRERAATLEKENLRLKNKVKMLEDKVMTMIEEQEQIRNDVVRQSQKNFECDADLYRRINEFTRKTLVMIM